MIYNSCKSVVLTNSGLSRFSCRAFSQLWVLYEHYFFPELQVSPVTPQSPLTNQYFTQITENSYFLLLRME